MTLRDTETLDLPTPTGPMRCAVFAPAAPGRYPGLVVYSEIFQITAPIRRLAAFFAGHGLRVLVPEVYHEYLPAGAVLAYDQPGADEGNRLKYTKPVAAHDSDAGAALAWLREHPAGNGRAQHVGSGAHRSVGAFAGTNVKPSRR
jgi:carboxymethylenebutenolidase